MYFYRYRSRHVRVQAAAGRRGRRDRERGHARVPPDLPASRLGRAEAGGLVERGRGRRSGVAAGFDANDVAGIGSGGQMHGLVALDEADNVIRPAIFLERWAHVQRSRLSQ